MNPFRAKRIADNLAGVGSFRVHNHLHHLQVSYRGQLACFDSEPAFWLFAFKIAQASHEESTVSEAEYRLRA